MKKLSILSIIIVLVVVCCCDITKSTTTTTTSTTTTTNYKAADLPEATEKSGVMLQAFTWDSCKQSTHWWKTIAVNATDIGIRFTYAWFPPCTDSLADNGYMPKELNNFTSSYGNKSELQSAINSIKPTKAIADIVINHRVGSTSWGDFTNPTFGVVKGENYKAICSNDEGFTSEPKLMGAVPTNMRGARDTGDNYGSARDLDHTNIDVRNGIVTWLESLKELGFVGWRYDYVRGYAAYYNGLYNAKTNAEFSVGELWPDNYSNVSWNTKINAWIKRTAGTFDGQTLKPSCAFDFVLKGIFNTVFGSKSSVASPNYGLLGNENILAINNSGYAVTFVDNHDTGSTQNLWPLYSAGVPIAYVYILTHPGYPCVAWQHYFDNGTTTDCIGGNSVAGTDKTLREHIEYLIDLRNDAYITNMSPIEILSKTQECYAAKITGKNNTLIVSIGSSLYSKPDGFSEEYKGTNWIIYKK